MPTPEERLQELGVSLPSPAAPSVPNVMICATWSRPYFSVTY